MSVLAHRPQLLERLTSITGLSDVHRLLEPGPPMRVPILELGRELTIRPGTSDVFVLRDTFVSRFHVPDFAPSTILDLGAHIGTTMAHFAHLYDAQVFGVEMDAENYSLCKLNAPGEVLHAAVDFQGGVGAYDPQVGIHQWGYSLGSGDRVVETISLETVLDHFGLQQVDYVKMDIEGAEREVLQGGSWPGRVKAIKVELHQPYTVHEAITDLTELGFVCRPAGRPENCVVGTRRITSR